MDAYNLDVIIGVGYRVNSQRGTQFRIWATQVLRDHIVKGYSVNERRLKELRQSIRLVGQVLDRHDLSSDEARALLRVVTDYERALDVLDDYDHQRVRPIKLLCAGAVGIEIMKKPCASSNRCATNSAGPACSGARRTPACPVR